MKGKPKIKFFNYDKTVFAESEDWNAELTVASCEPLPGHPGVYMILIDDLTLDIEGRRYLLSSPQYASSKSWLSNEPFDNGTVCGKQSGFFPGYHRCPGPKVGTKSAKTTILRWILDNQRSRLTGGRDIPEDALPSFRKCFDGIDGLFDAEK